MGYRKCEGERAGYHAPLAARARLTAIATAVMVTGYLV
jgi:hypothetical protein